MHGSHRSSRLALILDRLRGPSGITAPQMVVRAAVPWRWQLLTACLVVALVMVLFWLTYRAGERASLGDQVDVFDEVKELRAKTAQLEGELQQLRGIDTTSESTLQIERAAVAKLSSQVKALEEENTKLKENLAVFENIAGGNHAATPPKSDPISISRVRVEPENSPGRYRFRVLVVRKGTQSTQEVKASLQLQISVRQANGQDAMIVIPRPEEPGADKFAFSFKSYRSIEGNFQLPADVKIKRLEVRLIRDGAVQASQGVLFRSNTNDVQQSQ